MTEENPWQDEETLREMYIDKQMSAVEIAEHFGGITSAGIGYWIDKHGIEKRSRSEAIRIGWLKRVPNLRAHEDGYEFWVDCYEGEYNHVSVHRLLAVAKYGFDAVVDRDVHHKDEVPWHNVPDNIELMAREEHVSHHGTGRNEDKPWHDTDRLRELRVEKGLTLEEVGKKLGCSGQTIRRCLDRYGIEEPDNRITSD